MTLEITVTGKTESDLEAGLREAKRRFEDGCTSGHDESGSGSFSFTVTGEPEPSEDEE